MIVIARPASNCYRNCRYNCDRGIVTCEISFNPEEQYCTMNDSIGRDCISHRENMAEMPSKASTWDYRRILYTPMVGRLSSLHRTVTVN